MKTFLNVIILLFIFKPNISGILNIILNALEDYNIDFLMIVSIDILIFND